MKKINELNENLLGKYLSVDGNVYEVTIESNEFILTCIDCIKTPTNISGKDIERMIGFKTMKRI